MHTHACMCAHRYTHAHTHTYIRTHAYVRTHTYRCTHTHTYTHLRKHMRMHIRTHTRILTYFSHWLRGQDYCLKRISQVYRIVRKFGRENVWQIHSFQVLGRKKFGKWIDQPKGYSLKLLIWMAWFNELQMIRQICQTFYPPNFPGMR